MVSFVATPIGNLKDITLRALETLKDADVIFCEDTRHTIKLLNAYEIKKPLYACHKFNETEAAEKILAASRRGEKVAVVSDAGTPVVSDPGNIVCKYLRDNGELARLWRRWFYRRYPQDGLRLSGFCRKSRARKKRSWKSTKTAI